MLQTKEMSYAHSPSFKVSDISLEMKKGEIVSLIGPNGSGKSTVLRLISRLLKPEAGEVVLNGKDIHTLDSTEVARQLAMLPQTHDHFIDITVRELVEFGRHPHRKWFERASAEDEDIIDWALDVTHLKEYEYRMLHSLSGGERQRAWIAMAITQRTNLLLLDEPTTYLDIAHQLEVMELIEQLNAQYEMTIVMVLHDINQAAKYSHRLIAMKDGTICFDGIPQCVLCPEMFQQIFSIEVDIFQNGDKPYFTPIRRLSHANY